MERQAVGRPRFGPSDAARLASLVTASAATGTIDVRIPFTGATLGEIPRCGAADVSVAVRIARGAQPAWHALGVRKRSRTLDRFHRLVLRNREQLLDLVQLESGKARAHAFEEIVDTALVARYYARNARRYLKPRRRKGALPLVTKTIEVRHPVGVVGFVAPWNFPLILTITDLLAALAAGNAVVLRPDVQASFTALRAVELLREAGVPREVVQVVTGEGAELGPPLIEQVDFVMFTGSTRTGKIVARQAAERLIGYSLELGGKNPMIVLPDADFEAAVDGAVRGAFVGAGQVCVSVERIFVPQGAYAAFKAALVERTLGLKLGASFDYSAEVGSLATDRQLATVESHVADALEKGATLLAGGRRRPELGPCFYEPTILEGVRPGMTAYAEETFGPVVALYPYRDVDEAVERANDTRYGLNASVWSRSPRRAVKVASRIRCGSVNINEVYAATWSSTASPIGGMKESGHGRRHGEEGILKYTEAQTIAVQRILPLTRPSFLRPERYEGLMARLVKLMSFLPGR